MRSSIPAGGVLLFSPGGRSVRADAETLEIYSARRAPL